MATRESTRNGTARNGRRGSTSTRRNGSARKPRSGERPTREAVVEDVARGAGPRTAPGLATAKLGVRLALRPQALARRGLGLAAELGKVAAGASELEP